MAPAEPILLAPMLKHRAWGGDRLVRMGRKPDPESGGAPFGESWEVADLPLSVPGGRSRAVGGRFDGRTLRDAILADRDAILGAAAPSADGGFPLLVKFLDARENISVQVHPSRAHAERHPEALVKDEAWFVVDAEPGACIYRGVDPSLQRRDLEKLLDADRVLEALIREPVRRGDCIELPSGIIHAIGAGVLVAEVQTPSDTTYRLWDWGRRDPARPLHRGPALESALLGRSQRLESIPVVNAASAPALEASGFRTVRLCRSAAFEIELISAEREGDGELPLPVVTDGSPVIWIVLEGSVRFPMPGRGSAGEARADRWTTVLLPAASQGLVARVARGTRWLRVTIPDRMRHMLAGRA